MAKRSIFGSLYVQVLIAIVIGVALGHFLPETGAAMKPLGDGFIKLIKMIIAPIIFCTIVVGIAGMEDMKKVGKTGGLAVLYFEIVSTVALIIGLIVFIFLIGGVSRGGGGGGWSNRGGYYGGDGGGSWSGGSSSWSGGGGGFGGGGASGSW